MKLLIQLLTKIKETFIYIWTKLIFKIKNTLDSINKKIKFSFRKYLHIDIVERHVNNVENNLSWYVNKNDDRIKNLVRVGVDHHYKGKDQIIVLSKVRGDYVKIIDADFDNSKQLLDFVKETEQRFAPRGEMYFDTHPTSGLRKHWDTYYDN